ncbi:Cell division protein FtsA [hydrothermal vent metagenome]|uniref:Cell division protein FtsA n=1 Tax=hydrothermal vent metagenome TaxID=652676 RepID=A0A3B0U886_9ZZZZ
MILPTFKSLADPDNEGLSPRKPVVAALDIGTDKVTCVIARVRAKSGGGKDGSQNGGKGLDVKIVGVGHIASQGVKAGVIVDLAAAETAIRAAVDAAERAAGFTVDEAIVNASCGRISSEAYEIGVTVRSGQVTQDDLGQVLKTARAQPRDDGRLTLHSIPIGFALDGDAGIADPLGMYGERLSVGMHVVTAEPGPLRNLALGVDRCHIKIDRVAVSPLASALSTLTVDEAELGAICVDMGAGCTTVAVFIEGMFVHADAIALGGGHVTLDLARGLSTPLAQAERIKALHGSCLTGPADEREFIDFETVGGEGGSEELAQVPKSTLVKIVTPRVEEIFELLRDRLRTAGLDTMGERRIILTGGASQLTGTREIAARVLGGQVRMGAPRLAGHMPETMAGPGFACVAGLLTYAQSAEVGAHDGLSETDNQHGSSYIGRVGRWLKESF